MDELFGVPTSTIAIVTSAMFVLALLTVLVLFLKNRTMVKMGLRNIPRRGGQTLLVVTGLMLSTLIVTAAFTTGDTATYSVNQQVYNLYQHNDLDLTFGSSTAHDEFAAPPVQPYIDQAVAGIVARQFAGDADISTVLPYLVEQAPVRNTRTDMAEPAVVLNGYDPQALAAAGGLRLTNGGDVDLTALAEDQALVSQRASKRLGAATGDVLTIYAGDGTPYTVTVAGIVENSLASGVRGFGDPDVLPGIALPLPAVQRIAGRAGQVNLLNIALSGDVRGSEGSSDAVAERLRAWLGSPAGQAALEPYLAGQPVGVETSKLDAVEAAEQTGNEFTAFFIVMGLFSVAAGIMLIFMIFVMLAAERKPEMGMARAVGAQRSHLVQAFVAEGMAYSLMAGLLGAALGVGAAAVLVVGLMRLAGGDAFSFVHAHFTPTSLAIGYTLGVVVTFITVVFSSIRASRLNIVAAIRGFEDERDPEPRRKTTWKWVALGLPALVIPPLGLWLLLCKGFGLARAWVWGPLGLLAGTALILLGQSSDALFFFAAGISLLPLSIAMLARQLHAPQRLTWSIVGLLLGAYWLLPSSLHERLFGKLNGRIEMFVIAGIMLVIAFTLLIIFNARLLTTIFERSGDARIRYRATLVLAGLTALAGCTGVFLGDAAGGLGAIAYLVAGVLLLTTALAYAAARYPHIAPAMKMAVAYPLANRFRTGMTVAMFSLIIFSLTVFSVLTANFSQIFNGDDATGGAAIMTTANPGRTLGDLPARLRAGGSPAAESIVAMGRVTLPGSDQVVRQVDTSADWESYPVLAADAAFFGTLQPTLDSRANTYADDQAVLDAVGTQPGLALIDSIAIDPQGYGIYDWKADGVTITDKQFTPFQVEVRDPHSGRSTTVTVVGVLANKLNQDVVGGLYLNESTFTPVFGTPTYARAYLALRDGADAVLVAQQIQSALLVDGVQARSIQQLLDESSAEDKVFTRMFQGFMGLGLFVGIAALGVIAFRSVVERRQQIGMLRAIGYHGSTVALSFILESSFIALMGILSGVIGATILSRNLLHSPAFNTSGTDVSFFVPWAEVITCVVVAFVFSLLMTWVPARQAGRIAPAEALRYE